jgi:hypothetical protein
MPTRRAHSVVFPINFQLPVLVFVGTTSNVKLNNERTEYGNLLLLKLKAKFTNKFHLIESEVLTAMVMKNCIFRDIIPCSPLTSTDVSGEHVTSIFRVEELQARNQQGTGSKQSSARSLLQAFLRNFGWLTTDHTALHPRRWSSS